MRKPLFAVLLVTVASQLPAAHAAEKTIFDEAFPKVQRGGAQSAVQVGLGSVEVGGGTVTSRGLIGYAEKKESDLATTDYFFRDEAHSIAADKHPELKPYLDLKREEATLRFQIKREEAAPDYEVARENPTAAKKRRLSRVEELLAKHPLAEKGEAALKVEFAELHASGFFGGEPYGKQVASASRKFTIVKALGYFGFLGAVVDGFSRITAAANGRDPGFSAAVNLSRGAFKKAAAPVESAREPAEQTNMSAR